MATAAAIGTPLGDDPVRAVGDARIAATRYSLRGNLDLDLRYGSTAACTGMEFSVADRPTMQYERL